MTQWPPVHPHCLILIPRHITGLVGGPFWSHIFWLVGGPFQLLYVTLVLVHRFSQLGKLLEDDGQSGLVRVVRTSSITLWQTTRHGGTTRAGNPFWQSTVWQTTRHWLSQYTLCQTTSQGFYQFIDFSVPGEILYFTPAHLDRLLLTCLAGTISFDGVFGRPVGFEGTFGICKT